MTNDDVSENAGPEVHVQTAEGLLDVLSARKEPWHNDKSIQWLFRGQPSTTMSLLPRAWRDDYLRKLRHHATDPSGLVFFEGQFLCEFLEVCHRQGLRVPGEPGSLNAIRTGTEYLHRFVSSPSTWPPNELLPALALAQHHGVPTRLLDWSYRPYVAAYFAAVGALSMPASPSRIAVWCLNTVALRALFADPHPVEILPVASDGNSNLAAQRGAFTLFRAYEHRNGVAQPVALDTVILEKARSSGSQVLRCYSLPYTEARKLLQLLRAEGVDGAALFPGFQGAAEYALDRLGFRWSPVED